MDHYTLPEYHITLTAFVAFLKGMKQDLQGTTQYFRIVTELK